VAASDRTVTGYAQALLAIAQAEGVLERVQDELYALANAVEANRELREALTDAALPAENKRGVVEDILGERAHPLTTTLGSFLVEAGQARRLVPIAEELAREAAARSEKRLAEVRTAVALSDDQRGKLEAALSEVAGQPVELKVVVDPAVVGGVVARVGDEVFDGSVASRLIDARQHLTGSV
jgi:F-type H+-transporting ATPase subunit delta